MSDPRLIGISAKYCFNREPAHKKLTEVIFSFDNERYHSAVFDSSFTANDVCRTLSRIARSMDGDIHLSDKEAKILELREMIINLRRQLDIQNKP